MKHNIEPCNTNGHYEYWAVDLEGPEPVIVAHYKKGRDVAQNYYYCSNTLYGSVDNPHLCRSCMVKYGLLW